MHDTEQTSANQRLYAQAWNCVEPVLPTDQVHPSQTPEAVPLLKRPRRAPSLESTTESHGIRLVVRTCRDVRPSSCWPLTGCVKLGFGLSGRQDGHMAMTATRAATADAVRLVFETTGASVRGQSSRRGQFGDILSCFRQGRANLR